ANMSALKSDFDCSKPESTIVKFPAIVKPEYYSRALKKLAIFLLLAAACRTGLSPSPHDDLARIAQDYWQHQLDHNVALQIKFRIPTQHLADVSYAHAQSEAEFARSIVQRLDRIYASGLSEGDRLTLKILRWENQLTVDGLPYFWYRFQVTPYSFRSLGIQQ